MQNNNIPTDNNTSNPTDNNFGLENDQSRNQSQQGTQNAKEGPITLPKGGGAIQGMGEKFQANPVTGTGSMTVPINMSQGRSEFTPQLALSYDSGSGNSAFGLGWNIGLPQITRKTQRELPKYNDINIEPALPTTDGNKEDTFILSGAEDLVAVLEDDGGELIRKVRRLTEDGTEYIVTYYRPRTEGLFAKIERWYNTTTKITHWRSTSKENITTIYGESENARIAHPDKATKIFKWLIERSFDAKGNLIYYQYKKEDTENILRKAHEVNRLKNLNTFENKYLKTVSYGNKTPLNATNDFNAVNTAGWHFKLQFDYGEYTDTNNIPELTGTTWSLRQDPFSVYSPGFEIRTYRLCKRILMYHDFGTEFSGIVKSTDLTHNENPIAAQISSVTYKHYNILENDANEKVKEMPSLDFTYSKAELDTSLHQVETEDLKNIPGGIDSDTVRFADINATGIPGLLIEDKNAWYFKENLGDIDYYGTSHPDVDSTGKPHLKLAPIRKLAEKPSLAGVSSQSAPFSGSLTDIDGDGTPELMIFAPPFTGYYKQKTLSGLEPLTGLNEPEWQGFTPFSKVPNINMSDPNLRTIDITGDGNPDLLITEQNCFVCYPSAEEKGWEKAFRVSKTMKEEKGPAIVFNDGEQSIYLADMSGDGMTDIVRIKNGSIVYWANLGYGRFSAKNTMSGAPHFDRPDQFNQNRIRIADIDGSGTADILYFGNNTTTYWLNQSGNSFSEANEIKNFPRVDNMTNVFVTDFLGNGTSCIVWSSALPGHKPHHVKFMDLMSGTKPYLLIETDNNTGAVSRYQYAPSTKFYLKHKAEGNPWKTKLPFPVQVLERSETYDKITDTRFVSLYEYHDGYYDGYEREFRGFGMVEQRDTEKFANFAEGNLFTPGTNTDEESHIPPVLSKTWFHLGNRDFLNDFPSLNVLESRENLTIQEKREARRALRGSMLKQEIYAEDDTELEALPYSTTEKTYEIKLLQKQDKNKHAVFFVTEAETRTIQSERNLDDARIMQSITLEIDDYGNPLKTAQIAYPRGFLSPEPVEGEPEQQQLIITINENAFINEDANENFYLLGIPYQTKAYQLTGLPVSGTMPDDFFTKDFINDKFEDENTQEIPFEETPDTATVQKRLLKKTTILYQKEIPSIAENNSLLPGEVASHALPYQTYESVFTDALLTDVYGDDTSQYPIVKSDEDISNIVTDAKYIKGDSIYTGSDIFDDNLWYKPSEKIVFDENKFFLPIETHDIFGNKQVTITYEYGLLPETVTDILNNTITAINNYRVLQARKMTDINDNTQEVVFDTRGMVIATVVQGKNGEGDTLDDPTTELIYDLFNYKDNQKPNYIKTTARVWHYSQENDTTLTGFQPLSAVNFAETMQSYTYTGGLGQEIMTKVQAEDDTDDNERWVGTGRTVLNNKGKVVKQYEPYFSDTEEYETEDEMPAYGVTPIMHYDSLGRPIKTDLPDGTFTKVEFTPWEVKNYDTNDTVWDSRWLRDNSPFEGGEGDVLAGDPVANPTSIQRAALLTIEHANTPQTVYFDVLGREFLTEDDNGAEGKYTVRNRLDITGNITKTTDAKGREMTEHTYDMAGRLLRTYNIDSATRIMLPDAADKPLRQADSRDHILSFEYDTLQRPVVQTRFIASQSDEATIIKTEYGTNSQTHKDLNLNGQTHKSYDQSGITTAVEYDFKGNPLQTQKEFCNNYQNTIDWSQTNSIIQSFNHSTLFDALNRPVKQTKPDGSIVLNRFNKAGLLEKVQMQHSASPGTFADYVTNIDYNEKAQRTKIEYGNGTVTTYEYDENNFRLTNLLTKRGSDTLQDISYVYDPEGNITEIEDNAQSVIFHNNSMIEPKSLYEYDALYRLIKANGREHLNLGMATNNDFINTLPLPNDATALQNFTQTYEYDEIGNIKEMKSVGGQNPWTRNYQYNFDINSEDNNYLFNHDHSSSNPDYLYDAHGNMTKMPHLQEMKYDYADQLNEVTLNLAGNKAYYVYDASGERVRKVVVKNTGTIVEDRFYVGDYEIYTKKTNGTLDTERETLHIQDDKSKVTLIDYDTQNSTTTVRYQYTNHLHSASLELDETGAIITYEEYHPFGTTSYRSGRNEIDVSLKRYKYVHKELDNETGLYYYGMRYYAPWVARFVNVDPLLHKFPFYTPYQYSGNNPVTFYDLDGNETTPNEKTGVPVNSSEKNTFKWTVSSKIEGIIIDNRGYILDSPNTNNLNVYMKEGNSYTLLGKLGETINASPWFGNLINENSWTSYAKTPPWTFYSNVKEYGVWDYKYRSKSNKNDETKKLPHHILGVAFYRSDKHRGKGDLSETLFTFAEGLDRAVLPQDLNNFHFGAIGNAWGIPEAIQHIAAGYIEQGKWDGIEQKNKDILSGKEEGEIEWVNTNRTKWKETNGDNPVDYEMMEKSYDYYNTHFKQLRKPDMPILFTPYDK